MHAPGLAAGSPIGLLLMHAITEVSPFRARNPDAFELVKPEESTAQPISGQPLYRFPSPYPADYVAWAKLPNPSFTPSVEVPKGASPDGFCSACCRLVDALEESLLGRLREVHRQESAKRTKTLGALDDLAQEGIDSGCHFASIWHDKEAKKWCTHILEKRSEQLAASLVAFVSKEPTQLQTTSRLRVRLCWDVARACAAEAAERWEAPTPKLELISERPMLEEHNQGAVYRAVGANVDDQIGAAGRDVVV